MLQECASAPCLNNGKCLDSSNGFSCKCESGFSGELCQFNNDDCAQNELCLNDGDCVDGDNDFSCSCKAGFAGSRYTIYQGYINLKNTSILIVKSIFLG